MTLKSINSMDCLSLGIDIVECDVCGQRFSANMIFAWPFCETGVPHGRIKSNEQLKYRELLLSSKESPDLSYIPKLHGYPPSSLNKICAAVVPPVVDKPTVVLPREMYIEISDWYKTAGLFIGNVLGKHNWTTKDLIDYSLEHWSKDFKEV